MRILAIDHGNARAGCAVCDPSETIARPLEVIEPPDPEQVARLAAEEGAELIVVGLPVSLDGAEREQAEAARRFAAALGARDRAPGRDLRRATDDRGWRRESVRAGLEGRRGLARRRPPARELPALEDGDG